MAWETIEGQVRYVARAKTASNDIEIVKGSRKVIAFRNDPTHKWSARLYVNNGETATLTHSTFKTEKGLRRWADKVLSR